MTVQIVFAVKYRQSLILPTWENKLHGFISGIVKNKGFKLLAINGMPDHVHILLGMKPDFCVSDLVREIKKSSSKYINTNNLSSVPFSWQNGYGIFTYHHSIVPHIIKYILNQKDHHKHVRFADEYRKLMIENGIVFDERYLLDTDDIDEDPTGATPSGSASK